MNRMQRVESAIRAGINPDHLDVVDESHQHASRGSAFTHLRVVVVSAGFEGLSRVARQQQIYGLLDAEFKGGLHALALRTLTPQEWAQEGGVDQHSSPACAGSDPKGPKRPF